MSYTIVIWIRAKPLHFKYDATDAADALMQFVTEHGKRLEPHQLNQIHIGPTVEPSITGG